MPIFPKTLRSWRHLAEALAIVCGIGVAGVAAFAWSGLYNISAARDHLPPVTWFLEVVRDQSMETQSAGVDVPPLDDPDLVLLGAAHYEGVCAACHSRPGETVSAVVAQMLPSPPLLARAIEENSPEEIFWVVKHGLKYTGMPAWPTQSRDDEVWAVTAFLVRLAAGDPMEDYRPLAGLDRPEPPFPAGTPTAGVRAVSLVRCSRCHDDAGLPTHGSLVPRLGGQSETYLRRALAEYARGERPSGVMQPVAQALRRAETEELVRFYAGLAPGEARVASDPARVERGRILATAGAGDRGLPPCLACHGAQASAQFPRLAGQNAAYIERQLQVFRAGGRAVSTYGQIMTAVARRLTPEESADVAAYFSTRPDPATAAHAGPAAP